MLKDWLRINEEGNIEIQKIDLESNTPYWEKLYPDELSNMEIGHYYDIPFEVKEILMKYIMLVEGDGRGAISKFEKEAKLFLEGKLKVFVDCDDCQYKTAYEDFKRKEENPIETADKLKEKIPENKMDKKDNLNLGINNKKPIKTNKTVPESDFKPENLFVLNGWIAGKNKLPEKVVGVIIDERPKALRIRHRDGDFWTPKSAVQVKSLPEPQEK